MTTVAPELIRKLKEVRWKENYISLYISFTAISEVTS